MISNKKVKNIAHKIADIERKAQTEPSFDYSTEFEKLIEGLDISDLLMIDEYIMKKKLLTK